jgi:Ran-binding protein 3
MCQISQGIEDINWKGQQKVAEGATAAGEPLDAPQTEDAPSAQEHEAQNEGDEGFDPVMHVPSSPKSSVMDVHHEQPETQQSSRRGSQSDTETDKGLKRKLDDRATSQGPHEEVSKETADLPKPGSVEVVAIKRSRDDADHDDNPRETKRPSPPPAEVTDECIVTTYTSTTPSPVTSVTTPSKAVSPPLLDVKPAPVPVVVSSLSLLRSHSLGLT